MSVFSELTPLPQALILPALVRLRASFMCPRVKICLRVSLCMHVHLCAYKTVGASCVRVGVLCVCLSVTVHMGGSGPLLPSGA